MWPNPQFPADSVTFTEEILYGKLFWTKVDFLHAGTYPLKLQIDDVVLGGCGQACSKRLLRF